METNSSSTNLLGLSNLLNKDSINPQLNAKNIELDFLSDISANTNNNNIYDYNNEIYNKDIRDIANNIGLNMDTLSDLIENNNKNDKKSLITEDDGFTSVSQKINKKEPSIVKSIAQQSNKDSSVKKTESVRNDYPSLKERFIQRSMKKDDECSVISSRKSNNNLIGEKKRFDNFNRTLNEIKPSSNFVHNFDLEESKNKKTTLLEEIELLKMMLQEENENINVPVLTEDDSIDKLEHVYKLLKIKKDRIQFNTLGEEFIMFMVYMVEGVFNGERVIFGKFKPDLTGWHNSVAIKLRKMRYETSTAVSEVVDSYKIGYGTRLCLELLPSLFLYSKMRTTCKKKYSKNSMDDNLSRINLNNIQ